jgi:serine protease AprX
MHPGIEAFARSHPGAAIPVIFRTDGDAGDLAGEVEAEGATDVYALDMIGGVAASVTLDQLERLAHDDDVDWVAFDAEMTSSSRGEREDEHEREKLKAVYPFAAGAPDAWSLGATGDDVTVAVIDSGISGHEDFQGRVRARFDVSSVSNGVNDENGHGTYVAGIIGGHGKNYTGMAPETQLLSLRVLGRDGVAFASDVVAALQWVVDHRDERNIRVVNISLTSTVPDSYKQDPLDAAVEQAWLDGVVVVVAAGNYGTDAYAVDHAPANDPYVITVGGFDDRGTRATADDSLASWSSRGVTVDGYGKPDLIAPGVAVTSTLAKGSSFVREHRSSVVDKHYITLDGTSASAAVVSGAAALLLSDEPWLTPNQVKFRLTNSGVPVAGSDAPGINAGAAVSSPVMGEANTGAVPNDLIDPLTGEIMYDSVLWRSVLWRSVLWRSVEEAVLWRR